MIRLLTAVLFFASFHAVAEVTLTELNNNTPADADDVMGNFNALKNEIESLPTPPTDCTADQIIKWNDANGIWVCATDPFAGLNCDVGDQLRMGSGGWECRAEPITASLIQNSWDNRGGVFAPVSTYFDGVNNVETNSNCDDTYCFIKVIGVADHSSCVVQVTGGAVSGSADVTIDTLSSEILIHPLFTWNQGQPVYINISCRP